MKKFLVGSFLLNVMTWCFAQQDSIIINAKLSDDRRILFVNQEMIYHNPHSFSISQIKLQNWIAAYQNRKTPLLKRKLEDRKRDLYFAKPQQLGRVENLNYQILDKEIQIPELKEEVLYLPLDQELAPKESVKIKFRYQLTLPDKIFTGYGTSYYNVMLKYFFIVPDSFEDDVQSPGYFLDVEQNLNSGSFWNVNFELPKGFLAESNLNKTNENNFEGTSANDPEFLISPQEYPQFTIPLDEQIINLQFGYELSKKEKEYLRFYLPSHLAFLKKKVGNLPTKIFISEKLKEREKFIGIDDIRFWKFHYQLFTDSEKIDLNYLSILSKSIINSLMISNKKDDHWLKNGIKTYLEMQYLQNYYPTYKLLGNLPD